MSSTFSWDGFERTGGASGFVRWTEKGQVVEGIVAKLAIGQSLTNQPVPELTINTTDGECIVTASQQVLMNALLDNPPDVGDSIRIEYLGEGERKAGSAYNPPKLFKVTVTHASSGVPAEDLI